MKISLRGDRKAPMLCYEREGGGYSVEMALKWIRENPSHIPDELLAKVANISWNTRNFIATQGLWDILRQAAGVLDAVEAWTHIQVIPASTPYLPPVLDPPLFFGLAGNCPMTWRSTSRVIPNYPVGYTRTCHTLTGHLDRVMLPAAVTSFRCAVELGVVIERRARNVSRQDAMQYVAGYSVVNDMISNHWKDYAAAHNASGVAGFEELLITSYYGRGTTGFAPFGPYIIDRAEIENPYDLMMYSRINDALIDRSYTNAMVVGIESAIEYLSHYFTLEPGSVIHMGTMGLDGITLAAEKPLGRDDFVELEIEKIGSLKVFFDDLRECVR